jgi:fatty-acyl-CoA synthase
VLTQAEPRVHLRRVTPVDFLERTAFVYRSKIGVVDGDIRRTYPQMLERVAVLAKNQTALLEAHFAVPLAGGVLCPLNIRLVKREIEYIVGHCGASVIIFDAQFASLVEDLAAPIRRVRVGGEGDGLEFESWLAAASNAPVGNPVTDDDTTIAINYTSGTSGLPKGVVYTHRGAYQNSLAEIFHSNLRPESVYLWTLPMFHCDGWCYPWAVTAAAATHICLPKVDAAIIFDLVEREGVTHLCAAPTVLINIINYRGARRFPRPVTVIAAGAPPAPATIAQMEALGATITQVYGLTETYGPIMVCAWQSQWDELPPARRAKLKARQGVGLATIGANDIRVVFPRGDDPAVLVDVPKDGATQGEIVMRGNNIMKGYYNDPEATERAFAGGYFHSGDVAVWHPDGYIEIQDRSKDIIISGGENISSVQVESALLEHPDVLEVAVVARPDDKWGEVPKAYVTLKPGRSVDEQSLIAHCRTVLPGFKVPKAVEFIDILPKTPTGKIQKFMLRDREWADRTKRVH